MNKKTSQLLLSVFLILVGNIAFAGDLSLGITAGGETDGSAPFSGTCSGGATSTDIDGDDCGPDNDVIRTQDLLSTNFSVTSNNGATTEVIIEHTIVPGPNATVAFTTPLPAICGTGTINSSIVGNVLTCNIGTVNDGAQASLNTNIQVSGVSHNAATFSTTARVYNADGTANVPASTTNQGPFTISAIPKYDIDLTLQGAGSAFSCTIDQRDMGNGLEFGWICPLNAYISTDDPFGSAALANSFTYKYEITAVEDGGAMADHEVVDGLDFQMLSCVKNGVGYSYAVGGSQSVSLPLDRSVLDSGDCTFTTTAPTDAGPDITVTIANADTSGTAYPVQRLGGADLSAGPFYSVAHGGEIFLPFRAVDSQDGNSSNNAGRINLTICAAEFDPDSDSTPSVSNFGAGSEPTANNCWTKLFVLSATGSYQKINVGPLLASLNDYSFADLISTSPHSGDGKVEPNQPYVGNIRFDNSGTAPLENIMGCDFFDNTTQVLTNVEALSGSGINTVHGYVEVMTNTNGGFDSTEWQVEYTSINTGTDTANDGVFNNATGTYGGDWSTLAAARCDDSGLTWVSDPTSFPGGIDDVNGVRVTAINPATTSLNAGGKLYVAVGLAARENYYTNTGGTNTGEIPLGTILANFGGFKTTTLDLGGTGLDSWTPRNYAGDSSLADVDGDRHILTKAQLRLTKESITPAAAVGNSAGVAVAGTQVIWQLNPVVNSVNTPNNVPGVVVYDVLPSDAYYNATCTNATSGGTPASLVEPDTDIDGNASPGNTRLTFNLGTVPANTPLDPIIFCTDTNALADNNTAVVNYAEIQSAASNDNLADRSDTHTITLQQQTITQIQKLVDNQLDPINDPQVYTVEYENFGPSPINAPVMIDVFPFNGDDSGPASRTPPSDFSASSSLGLAAAPTVTDINGGATTGTFEYTNDASSTISHDPTTNTSTWCQIPGCGFPIGDATAVRFTSSVALASAGSATSGQRVVYTLNAAGNDAGDLYTNRAGLNSSSFAGGQSIISNPVSVSVEDVVIGIAKQAGSPVDTGDTYDVTYTINVVNVGDVELHDIQVVDDLTTEFGTSVATIGDVDTAGEYFVGPVSITSNVSNALSVNGGYNGAGDQNLLNIGLGGSMTAGEIVTLQYTVRFHPIGLTFDNQATASGDVNDDDDTNLADGVDDLSDDGSVVDADNDGEPNEAGENDPTTITVFLTDPPTLSKTFSPTTIGANAASTMTLVLTNPNNVALTGAALTDNYPTNLVNRNPANETNSCGGTLTSTAGGTSAVLSGGTIPANGSCTITVEVTSSTLGSYTNTTGAIETDNAADSNTATDDLTVAVAPTLTKTFNNASLPVGGVAQMSIQIQSPVGVSLSGMTLTDVYPIGMVTAPTPGIQNLGCGGTITAAAGSADLTFTGGVLGANAICIIRVNVTANGSGFGDLVNTTSVLSTNETADSGTASATINVPLLAPTLAKAFTPSSVATNGTSAMTITITNPNNVALTGGAFTDGYPAVDLKNANPSGGAISCSDGSSVGTVTATPGDFSTSLSGATIPASGSCTVTVTVTASVQNSWTNTVSTFTSTEAPNSGSASADITFAAPPLLTKSFSASSINSGDVVTMNLQIQTPVGAGLTGMALTDVYPAGMVTAAVPNIQNGCGGGAGTVTAAPGGSSLTYTGGSHGGNAICIIRVNVTSNLTTSATLTNTTGALSSNEAPNSAVSSASLSVVALPSLTKVFSPDTIPAGGTSVMTLTITNPNNSALTQATMTDTYPAAISNATAGSAVSTCGGTVTSPNGPASLGLTGGTIPANGSCTLTVTVTSTTAGAHTNTTGVVDTLEAGDTNTASDVLTVIGAPTLTKVFTPNSVPVGGTSTMTLTLTNPNPTALTAAALSDTYPAGLIINATPDNEANTCGGALTSADGGASIAMTGGTIPASGSCNITVVVASSTPGTHTNTTGVISTAEAPDSATATDDLVVTSVAPTLTKTFAPAAINAGGTSTMTLVLTNTNSIALTAAALTDTYPVAISNAATPNASTTCGGTVTSPNGPASFGLTGGTIPANGSCNITVVVTSDTSGTHTNTTGAITTAEAPISNTATDDLVVASLLAPTLTKVFNADVIPSGGTSVMTLTLTNPNAVALTAAGLTDTYPTQITNAAAANASTTCGGTATAANSGVDVVLAGGTIPANGNCTVTVTVTSSTGGAHTNTTGFITTAEAPNSAAASDVLTVLAAPTLSKTFAPNSIPVGGTSTMTLVLTNPNATALTAAALSDTYPAGLIINATPDSEANTCGGSLTSADGGASIAMTGGTIPASGSCNITVVVASSTPGTHTNTTGVISTAEAPDSGTATDDLVVTTVAPTLTKAFAVGSIEAGGTTTMTLTINNPNAIALTGMSLNDSYPANLLNATPANANSTCTGGTLTTPGGNSVDLTGSSIPANSSCNITVVVTSSVIASYTNTTGVVDTNEAPDSATASAVLAVTAAGAPTLTKVFAPDSIPAGGTSTMTLTIQNNIATPLTGLAFTDTYPVQIVNSNPANATNTCNGTLTSSNDGLLTSLTGGTLAANASCTITVVVTSVVPGTHTNTTSVVTSNEAAPSGAASDDLEVTILAPVLAKSIVPSTIPAGGTSTMTLTITNNNDIALTGMTVGDTYPAAIVNAAPADIASTCTAGTLTGTAGANALSLTGSGIPANSVCTVTVTVTSSTGGTHNNTADVVETTEAPDSNDASASLTVIEAPTLTKAFAPDSIPVGGTSTMTLTLTNPNASALTAAALSDTYPGAITNATPDSEANTCAGTLTSADGGASIAMTGGTIPANSSCNITVVVTSVTGGTHTNTTGVISTAEAPNSATATDDLVVAGALAPTLTKVFNADVIEAGATSTMTLTITNPNGIPLTSVALTDNYPGAILNATPANGATTCGGTLNSVDVGPSIELSGGTIAANSSCEITVVVTSSTGGAHTNTTGSVTSAEAPNSAVASDILTVIAAPTLTKVFAPDSIAAGGTSTMTLTLTNPNATALTAAALSDTYPAGLIVNATPDSEANTCGGALVSADGGASIAMTGGTIPASGSCNITVVVTSASGGTHTNTTGVISTAEAPDSATATDDLIVAGPLAPTLTKAFNATTIPAGTTSTMTVTIGNPNAIPLTAVALTDNYPAAITNATPDSEASTCGGTLTSADGGSSIALSGGAIAANASCEITVVVTSSVGGSHTNTTSVVTSTEAPASPVASAVLNVIAAPTLTKTFAPDSVEAGGTSTMTLVLTNPNTIPLTGATLSDTYPVAITNATPDSESNTCGGTLTSADAGTSIALAGGTIPASGSCIVTVVVTSSTPGTHTNTTSVIGTVEAPDSATATDDLVVADLLAPTLTKVFAPDVILDGGTSTLTLTIENPNGIALTALALNDTYPATITNATPASAASTCGAATIAAADAGTSVDMSGGTIAANSSCTINVIVTSMTIGTHTNTTGVVSSAEAPDSATATDDLRVDALQADLTVSIDDGVTTAAIGNTLTYTITVTNNGPQDSGTGFTVTDTMPVDLTVNGGAAGAVTLAGANAADWSCNANAANPQVLTCAYSGTVLSSGSNTSFSFDSDAIVVASNGTTLTNDVTVNPDPNVIDLNLGNNDDSHAVPVDALAALTGTVWLDANGDNVIDNSETLLDGWTVNVLDASGNLINDENGNPATAVTDAQGFYSIPDLAPGGYTVQFVSVNGVTFEQQQVTLPVNIVIDVPLPIDPSGVVYDAVTRLPVAGATLTFIDDTSGDPVPAACLLPGQQNQVTDEDGNYRFDIAFDAPAGTSPGCPTSGGSFSIEVAAPTGYSWVSMIIPAQTTALDATTCPGDAIVGTICEVQAQDTAPQAADDTTYYLSFDLTPGDQDVVNNHIPLDPPPANIILSKSANKSDVLIGDLVQYSLEARNDSDLVGVVAAQVVDNLPAGFNYVDNTATAVQAGPDGILNTGDDAISMLNSTGTDPVTFSTLNFAPGETIIIRYLVRVSTGVSNGGGDYINVAQITDALGNELSNIATAAVRVDEDPLLEKTTVIGKVFHDRDQDGYQDNADATGLMIASEAFGWEGMVVGDLAGRVRVTDPIDEHQTEVRMPYNRNGDNSFTVRSKQGSRILVDNDGNVSYDHESEVARGMSGQQLEISMKRDTGTPTVRGDQVIAPAAAGTEVLVITITNVGIHEEGIPGVRLATVEGLLIETDQYGRYHIAGVDTGHFSHGTNYIVKVDDATLPEGSTFTTENPRVLRLTQGLMTRFNFGVDLPDMVEAMPVAKQCEKQYETYTEGSTSVVPQTQSGLIDPVRFASGKSQIPAGYVAELRGVIAGFSDRQNLRLRFIGHTDNEPLSAATTAKFGSNQGLSDARARMVADLISAELGMPDLPISTEGYGDTQPVASNATRAGMAQNRRVELELIYDQVTDAPVEKTRVVAGTEDCGSATATTSQTSAMAPQEVTEMVTQTLGNAIDPVRFASGKSQIPAGYVDQLRAVLDGLQDKQNVRIRFTGHTDNERLGPSTAAKYGDNLGLSKARARQVADVISAGLGMPDLPVAIDGFADTRPLASNATREGMAQNRRVEIEVLYDEAVTKMLQAAAPVAPPTARSITLPHGGVIWATEDPGKADPRLDIMASGPLTIEGSNKITPINFVVYSNYQAFIESYTITMYAENDLDLAIPLTQLVGRVPHFDKPIEWDGYLQNGARPEAGEHLIYVLEVSDGNGHTDRTAPQMLKVVDGNIFAHDDESNADRTYGGNVLARQTIPLSGSRVRLHGEDMDHNYTLMINEQPVNIGENNNFVYEQQLPMGDHHFDIQVSNAEGVTWDRDVDITVDGGYLFIVAMANLTLGENDVNGDISPLNGDHHFDGDTWLDGRVAAYLKGKVKGKYMVTAQIDTTEDDLDNLGNNLSKTDPRSVFRRLDPDQYYPVYGDDSTTVSDVDTQGAFYLRVDWDKNKALWGNYNTQITGTEFAQYNRSLYGAQFVHESLKTNDYGDSQSAVYAFASEAQTANAHNEFLATGGSLYYLRETDIVRGSEKVWVEVRARDSERVVDLIPMEEGRDYQIDYLQGRIILNRPLSQVASQSAASIIKDQALEGDDVILAVDYEYVPQGFSGDDISAGVRGKGWLGNMIGIGATYITEERSNAADYTLNGIDVTLKAGKGTWIKAEYAESEAAQSSTWLSSNGGLSFAPTLATVSGTSSSGEAISLEGQINLAEITDGDLNARINAWYKDREAGFSSTRTNDGIETSDIGIEATYENDLFAITARANELEQNTATTRTANLQAKVGVGEVWSVIGELRYEDSDQSNANLGFTGNGDALLGAVGLEYHVNAHTDIWGSLQSVISDNANYRENDAFTLGARSQFSEHLALSGEITSGDRGDALNLGIDWSVSDNINLQLEGGFGDVARSQIGTTFTTAGGLELYGSYATDTDRADNEQERLTFGQSQRYGDGSRIFAEQQFTDDERESGIANVFGIDHRLTEQMNLSASLQTSSIDTAAGSIDRNAGSVGFDYKDGRTLKASTRLEFREDSGVESTTQWLTTNALDWQQSDHMRWMVRLNLSVTENDQSGMDDGQFIEADIGFAYRPVSNDRLNILGKYSYLYDLPASLSTGSLVGQNDSTADERMHVFSVEALYDLSRKWEIGAKFAARQGQTRAMRGQGAWFDSGANLAALRARYHLVHNWDALIEYHVLSAEAGDDQRDGALLALYRHVGNNFKIGIGYNFTDFSDDLTNTSYDANGFFIDLTGKY